MREREVLRLLAQRLEVGDDCAVIPFQGTNLLLTTDMVHRATDLPKGASAYTIGWRAAAVSFSDIAAMGGRPLGLVLALGAPQFERGFIEELLAGLEACCHLVGAELLGGDLDRHQELTLVSTALGLADRPILRSGAKAGELVCLTGPLGRTAVALKLFRSGQLERANELFRFTPRVQEGLRLAPFASAMMDISDGLARSLYQLAEASGVGFRIEYEEVPVLPEVEELAADERARKEMALFTGEDFELLFTLPEERLPAAREAAELFVIGQALPGKRLTLVEAGKEAELADLGYEH
ncbi:MAG: thiamine-phosphate kinase [Candidatus Acetothermia bacterium]|jgi:thiamine-monophosphate kinase|nr:thiamine-phosphate kinase [Candidatus Acetothermia bacterium]MDH7504927.1 thiamine-phosphate kinase [Candidatus Acetothermia bacterium]